MSSRGYFTPGEIRELSFYLGQEAVQQRPFTVTTLGGTKISICEQGESASPLFDVFGGPVAPGVHFKSTKHKLERE